MKRLIIGIATVSFLSGIAGALTPEQVSFDQGFPAIGGLIANFRADVAHTRSLYAKALAALPSGWSEYSYPFYGYAISAPVKPQTKMDIYYFKLGSTFCAVYALERDGAPQEAIRRVKAQHERRMKKPIIDISINGYPGFQVDYIDRASDPEKLTRERFYADGKREYTISASTPKTEPFHPDTDKFFDSFRLLKP